MSRSAVAVGAHVAGVSSFVLPGLFIAVLAFRSGGFSPEDTAAAVLLILGALGIAVVMLRNPFRAQTGPALVAIAAFCAFAAWGLASADWSHAPARATLEYDRTLLYLATLVLFASVGRSPAAADRLVMGLAVAFVCISVAALGPYLLPSSFPLTAAYPRVRLSWPTSYWNTTGVLAAFGIIAATYGTCSTRALPLVKIAAAACVPLGVAVVWFSVSRGAVLVLLVSLVALMVLGRWRGALTGLPTVVLGAATTCLICSDAQGLAAEPIGSIGVASGEDTARLIGVVVVGVAALRAVLLVADRSLRDVRWPRISSSAQAAMTAMTLTGVVIVFVAADGPSRVRVAAETFTSDAGISTSVTPQQRFGEFTANGRIAHYRVAFDDGVREEPIHGTGWGTFANLWAKGRPTSFTVIDAHSLYLESLAELGVVGLGLLLLAVGTMVGALVRRGWKERGSWAVLAALAIGWCVGAAFDWYWEMPAVTLWLFAAGGLALSRAPAPSGSDAEPVRRPTPMTVRVTAVAALAALATIPVAVYRSQTAIADATKSFRAGDCRATVKRALDATAALNSRPEPFELLTYCDIRSGRTVLAAQAARAAIKRDPHNWEFHYVLALAQAAGGKDPRRATREALMLNPLDPRTRQAFETFRAAPPERWRSLALASPTLVPGRP